jgi:hypothetical protein
VCFGVELGGYVVCHLAVGVGGSMQHKVVV